VEDALVAVLKQNFPKLEVKPFPESPRSYHFKAAAGAVFVVYVGSDFGEPENMDYSGQGQRLEYDILVVSRSLRDHTGAYVLLEGARAALEGFSYETLGLYFVRERYEPLEDFGLWGYRLTVRME